MTLPNSVLHARRPSIRRGTRFADPSPDTRGAHSDDEIAIQASSNRSAINTPLSGLLAVAANCPGCGAARAHGLPDSSPNWPSGRYTAASSRNRVINAHRAACNHTSSYRA